MASVDKRPNGHYRARWREHPGGPQKVRHFARKRDAERFLDTIRGDIAHGMYVDPAGGGPCSRSTPSSGAPPRCTGPGPSSMSSRASASTPTRTSALPCIGITLPSAPRPR